MLHLLSRELCRAGKAMVMGVSAGQPGGALCNVRALASKLGRRLQV